MKKLSLILIILSFCLLVSLWLTKRLIFETKSEYPNFVVSEEDLVCIMKIKNSEEVIVNCKKSRFGKKLIDSKEYKTILNAKSLIVENKIINKEDISEDLYIEHKIDKTKKEINTLIFIPLKSEKSVDIIDGAIEKIAIDTNENLYYTTSANTLIISDKKHAVQAYINNSKKIKSKINRELCSSNSNCIYINPKNAEYILQIFHASMDNNWLTLDYILNFGAKFWMFDFMILNNSVVLRQEVENSSIVSGNQGGDIVIDIPRSLENLEAFRFMNEDCFMNDIAKIFETERFIDKYESNKNIITLKKIAVGDGYIKSRLYGECTSEKTEGKNRVIAIYELVEGEELENTLAEKRLIELIRYEEDVESKIYRLEFTDSEVNFDCVDRYDKEILVAFKCNKMLICSDINIIKQCLSDFKNGYTKKISKLATAQNSLILMNYNMRGRAEEWINNNGRWLDLFAGFANLIDKVTFEVYSREDCLRSQIFVEFKL